MREMNEIFSSNVFSDRVMRERLPKDIYQALQKTIQDGRSLNRGVANVVANAMKDWAIERGVTHYTHWFQPMTGITAEKHDSFIAPAPGGGVIMEFSGSELIKGEPDASSFPSGGIRATFEARGYTAWDPTSYAFIKDGTLCIPTAFCAYTGEALDQKTPLLRSMEAINKQALRVLKLFGSDATRVFTTTGPEQEYFLIDRELYNRRKDLKLAGRTLFGAKPPKGQELDDHYFGSIPERVRAFMKELDVELWKLGIMAKTEHNEAAPAQHELATIFNTTNIACDHNQLTMEMMKSIAGRHGLACLLHEKPFAGVNGNGKHNNWSMCTNARVNLLEPGDSPHENTQFLLFLTAVIKAVDVHQDLLRIAAASAGNDCRLGSNEAPPVIISMYLGDELTQVLQSIMNKTQYNHRATGEMGIGVHVLPKLPKDSTDRNRTSPFAFTGNKFEFRMPGSSHSVSFANVVINTIVADVLGEFAQRLENAEDFSAELSALIIQTLRDHKRIIFNGNNYSAQWRSEALERGLLCLDSTVDALPYLCREENVELFERNRVFSRVELQARYDIMLENYIKIINIEALTMADMASKDYLPAALRQAREIADTAVAKKAALAHADCAVEESWLNEITRLTQALFETLNRLRAAMAEISEICDVLENAERHRSQIIPLMDDMRRAVDELETLVATDIWPVPDYSKMLYSLQ